MQFGRYEEIIMNAISNLFNDQPELLNRWNQDIKSLSNGKNINTISKSFNALIYIIDKLTSENELMIKDIESWIHIYEEEIKSFVLPFIQMENGETTLKSNEDIVTKLMEQDLVESGSSFIYHKLRETISKNEFNQDGPYPTAFIANNKKSVGAIAQVRTDSDKGNLNLSKKEIDQWKTLTSLAITSMDDLTADLFDIISLIWMQKAEYKDQMIHFHSDDALNLRGLQGRKKLENSYNTGYRKKDRDEVMKRIAALSSIWIKIEKDRLRIIDTESEEIDEIDRVQFNPLFVVDSVTVAYRGEVPIGIYECSIRPGEIMAHYLYGSKKTSGYLALKALQYDPLRQKYHKRLARYLSWQWRIRQKKSDYLRPFTIGGENGLLNVLGLEPNKRHPHRTKDTLELVLDTLKEDDVIKSWNYEERYDETNVSPSNKGWLQDYWMKMKIHIEPPAALEVYYLNDVAADNEDLSFTAAASIDPITIYKSMIERESKFTLDEITPKRIAEEREKRGGISRLQASKEMGISHSILSRFERGLTNPSKSTLDKMKSWLEKSFI